MNQLEKAIILKHYAVEGSTLSMKGEWMQKLLAGNEANGFVDFVGYKGLLFSNLTLEKFIEEEFLHDRFDLANNTKRSIRTFSSGEQKKALLYYLIKQKPSFLIIDNPFDCLDAESVNQLTTTLTEISKTTPLVQVFKRKTDLLPFIRTVLLIENETFLRQYTLEAYEQAHLHKDQLDNTLEIPGPLNHFDNVPDTLVEMRNVSVSYEGRPILKGIDWKIQKGEFWQLSGPNGSGKTTLLTMIYGDNPKAFGLDLFLFGRKKGSGESVWDIKQKIGYFTPSMTELFTGSHRVIDMIISGLVDSIGLYRPHTHIQQQLAQKWLTVIGLEKEGSTWFYKLSQIQQRLVLIARAMIKHPPLLILDEPSTGLDDYSASLLVNLINKIANESQTAILYVSHRFEKGLLPQYRFTLISSNKGSIGTFAK